jgi:hypothetical protein
MSGARQSSNIYYLPVLAPVATPGPTSRWARLDGRLRQGWWRVRFTLNGIRAAFRMPHAKADDDELAAFLSGCAELASRRRRPVAVPAMVIDFTAARRRLRPAPKG